MTEREGITAALMVFADATDVVELQLLLPSHQFAALEAEAVRLELTIAALLRRAIGDFLQPPPTTAVAGEMAD